jgi:hypothetical protein
VQGGPKVLPARYCPSPSERDGAGSVRVHGGEHPVELHASPLQARQGLRSRLSSEPATADRVRPDHHPLRLRQAVAPRLDAGRPEPGPQRALVQQLRPSLDQDAPARSRAGVVPVITPAELPVPTLDLHSRRRQRRRTSVGQHVGHGPGGDAGGEWCRGQEDADLPLSGVCHFLDDRKRRGLLTESQVLPPGPPPKSQT